MLIRASGELAPHLFLVTLGNTCRYFITGDTPVIFDPGPTGSGPALLKRFTQVAGKEVAPAVALLTHSHTDRAGGLDELRCIVPNLKHWGSSLLAEEIPTVSRIISESEVFSLPNGLTIRCLPCRGHSPHGIAYLIEPHRYLVVDEGAGYFRGREFGAPGCDNGIAANLESLHEWADLDLAGLCLPQFGVLTGAILQKHLRDLIQNLDDICGEVRRAREDGIEEQEIKSQVLDAFYRSESTDVVVQENLKRSFESLWSQLATS